MNLTSHILGMNCCTRYKFSGFRSDCWAVVGHIFWFLRPVVDNYFRRFGRTYRIHLHGDWCWFTWMLKRFRRKGYMGYMGMMEEMWPIKVLRFFPSHCSDGPDFLYLSYITDKCLYSQPLQHPLNQNQSLWRRRQYVLPKCRNTRLLHGAETQKKTIHYTRCLSMGPVSLVCSLKRCTAWRTAAVASPRHVNPQQHRTELLCCLPRRTHPPVACVAAEKWILQRADSINSVSGHSTRHITCCTKS